MRPATEQRTRCSLVLCALASICMPGVAAAANLLHALFQEHAVLQRDKPINVWGEAAPRESLDVSLAAQNVSVQANELGHWHATLPALGAGGPHELSVRTKSGRAQ